MWPGGRSGWAVPIVAALTIVAGACRTAPGEPTEVEAAVCAAGQIDGDLRIHLAEEVLPPSAIPEFETRFGVTVETTFYDNPDELIAQVEARVSDYDLIIPNDETIGIMREDGLLIPLSPDALPGAVNLMMLFQNPPYDPASEHSIPYTWGTVGLGVNVNVAGGAVPATWGLVFDPVMAERFAGRVSLVDDARLALGAALKYLGYSLNSDDDAEIEQAAELLAQSRDYLAGFTTLAGSVELVDGETDVAQGPSGEMFDAFEAAGAWDDYTYVIPAEGAPITVQAMAIPVTATHPCTAHTFIDFLLDPARGAEAARWNRAASPNQASNDLLPETFKSDPALYPSAQTMANLEFVADTEADGEYVDAFERARR